ncbi:MAG: flavin reductase [Gloeocapsa sp. DLM2.Bin57]|nr:MAG: flavin reductase [Gloeocapsa sp. DLM2.Bin57]
MSQQLVKLDLKYNIWDRFFLVAQFVVIGSKEETGAYDLAPKHMAMPLGWDNYFGFVCTPSHGTYQNIVREKVFTITFPKPEQIVLTSLSASPRCEDHSKPSLQILPTQKASVIDGVFLAEGYCFLECNLDRIIDGFGKNSLIVGQIVAAYLDPQAARESDRDDQDVLQKCPLLVYLSPGRYKIIDSSFSFPFPEGFSQ